MFLELGLQVPAGLTHIREVAGFTGQTAPDDGHSGARNMLSKQ